MRFTIFLLSVVFNGALAAIPEWGQCGGKEYRGPVDCASGLSCLCLNPYYSQCLKPGTNVGSGCAEPKSTDANSKSLTTRKALPTAAAKPAQNDNSEAGKPLTPASSASENSTETSTGVVSGACTPYSGPKTGYATTTNYFDGQKGACGCGIGSNFAWQQNSGSNLYTAAGSQNLFAPESESSSWCGGGCGTCYELTNANAIAAAGQGDCTGFGETITVMITNLCPANGNQQWCSVPNTYGFPAHFDIMGDGGPGLSNGWNNPVVTYRKVDCPSTFTSDYAQCECAGGAQSRAKRGLTRSAGC